MQAKRYDVVTLEMTGTQAHALLRVLEYTDEHGSITQDEHEVAIELMAELNTVL